MILRVLTVFIEVLSYTTLLQTYMVDSVIGRISIGTKTTVMLRHNCT